MENGKWKLNYVNNILTIRFEIFDYKYSTKFRKSYKL